MTVTLLAMVTMNESNPMALAQYLKVTQPLMDRVGAKIVQRFEIGKPVMGSSKVKTVILVEYPNFDAVNEVFQSSEYEAVKPFRERAFSSYEISIVSPA